ncbi:HPP family protein [Pseudofulvibacter geojedonensis]|uniref:HPP family protein n=1 Tax=Pseudofulvibacter geojedonensis TaxID=1123758 RepID=A0ABW3HYQ6_9FLAO
MRKAIISFIVTILCFVNIYSVHYIFITEIKDSSLIAAFGAAAVLSFSNLKKTLSTKIIFIGSIIGALIGVSSNILIGNITIAIIVSISLSVFVMQLLKINYPPGGAIAIIPIIADKGLQDLEYLFVFFPVVTGITSIVLFSKIQIYINYKSNQLWPLKKQSKL